MVIIIAEYGFSAIVLTQAVTAYVLVSNFAATDWANDFNVKVFFVSHVITFVKCCVCYALSIPYLSAFVKWYL